MIKAVSLFCFLTLNCVFFNAFSQEDNKGLILNPLGGLHEGLKEIDVEIKEGFSVYYTTNGTEPSKSSGRKLSQGKIPISKNTVFRFAVYNPSNKKKIVTQSYFIERKHTIPVVSIVTDPAYFFDSLEGIYEMGCCADTLPPYKGANFWKGWERPTNVEFLKTDGTTAFNQVAGVRIFGGYSKALRQKSLAFFARKKYGDNRFRYKLFDQLPYKKYKNFILRNAGGDMIYTHIRDVFATQLVKETGLLIQEYRPVAVYINGEYFGKYNLREKINEHFINLHFGYPKDSLIIMRHNGDHQHGPPGDYRKFIKRLETLDLSKSKDLKYVDSKIDINNYMLYNICQIYTANGDAGGNVRYYKSMRDTAKWRWIFYDLDHSFNISSNEDYKKNSVFDFTTHKDEIWPNPPWSTLIIRKLLENDSLKHKYINYFSDLLNTTFKTERGLKLLDDLISEYKEELPYHFERWKTESRYNKSLVDFKLFIEKRPAVLLDQLKERFELGETTTIEANVDGEAGHLTLNTLKIKGNYKGTYFKNIPIYYEAHPYFDYEFKGWRNSDNQSTKHYKKIKSDHVLIEPIFNEREKSPFFEKVVITEIDASQGKKEKTGDWIEIYNRTKKEIDLSGWKLRDDKDENIFIFKENTILAKKSFIIIAEDVDNVEKLYTLDSIKVIGNINFGINKRDDKVRLYDKNEALVDKVDLSKFNSLEGDKQNWSRKDFRVSDFSNNNWVLESPTPGNYSLSYKKIITDEKRKEEKEKDKRVKQIFLYGGIGAGLLFLFLFFFTLWNKKRQSIDENDK